MSDRYDSKFLDDPEFQSLLVACLESLQRGETIDRAALARDFPKFAAEVTRFLDDRRLLEQVASEFADVVPSRVTIRAYEQTIDSNSPARDYAAGDRIRYIGEYEVLDEIARGGMGIVFKARQQKLGRVVALKMILAGRLADQGDVERFQREARAAAKLKHPRIVPVHETGEYEGRHYFTMDFVDGRSLADVIREASLPPRRAAEVVRQVAEAIYFAHQQGTVHRDLKPANVLMDREGQPHITDFGLAKLLENVDDDARSELTATGQILGTPSYMAPEQAAGKPALVGPASDVYSLGAILYACLTGRAPFVAESPVDTLLQVMRKEPVSPRDLNPTIRKDLETICLKCLNKEPHKRYGTAQELADDLKRFLESRPVVARPIGPISRTMRWCRRNKTTTALLCLLFLSMAAGIGISASYAIKAVRHAHNETEQRVRAENALAEADEQRHKAERAQQEAESQRDKATQARAQAERALSQEAEARREAEQQRERAAWSAYIAQMHEIVHVAESHDYGHLHRLLQAMIPNEGQADTRGWEWHAYHDVVQKKSAALSADLHFVNFTIDPSDPVRIIAIVKGGEFQIWDWKQRTFLSSFGPLPGAQNIADNHIAISPQGRLLAYGELNGTIRIVDLETQAIVQTIDIHTRHKQGSRITGLAWEPVEGKLLATSAWAGDIRIWDAATGELKRTVVEREPVDNIQNPNVLRTDSLDWHPTAGLASGHRFGNIRVWDPTTGEEKAKARKGNGGIVNLSWDPPGQALYVAGQRVWTDKSSSSNKLKALATHAGSTAWKDPTTFAIDRGHDIEIRTVNADEPLMELQIHSADVRAMVFADAHNLISLATDGTIQITDVDQYAAIGQRFRAESGRIPAIAWSHDDKYVAVAQQDNNEIVIRDADSLAVVAALQKTPQRKYVFDNVFHSMAWTRDGKQLVAIDHAGDVTLWEMDTQKQLTSFKTGVWHYSDLSLNHREDQLAISGADHCEVYTFPDFNLVAQLPGEVGSSVEFSGDDSQLWFTNQAKTTVLALPDGREVARFRKSPGDQAYSDSALSPSIGIFAGAGNFIRLYSVGEFKAVGELYGHRGRVLDVEFSPDGKRLASGGADSKVRIWDTKMLDEVASFDIGRNREVESLAWSNGGTRLIVGTSDGWIYLYGKSTAAGRESTSVAEASRSETSAEEEAVRGDGELSAIDRVLIDGLKSQESKKRLDALKAIQKAGSDAAFAVPLLLQLLKQPDSFERTQVIGCLGRIGPAARAAVPALHEILKSEEKSVTFRFEAARALAQMGPAGEVAIPTLIEILKDPGESKRTVPSGAREALGLMAAFFRKGDDGSVYLDSRDSVIGHAIGGLAAFGPAAQEAVPDIQRIQDDPNTLTIVREMAVEALKRIQNDTAATAGPHEAESAGDETTDNIPPCESNER